MELWAFTFGVQYADEPHPSGYEWVHPDGVVLIEAPNEPAARQIMVAYFGTAWSSSYPFDRAELLKRFPRGILAVVRLRMQPSR